MRCQHANSNLPWMLNAAHLAVNGVAAVTMLHSGEINSLNRGLRGNKTKSLIMFYFLGWLPISLPLVFPFSFSSPFLHHPIILPMLLHNICSAAFTFNSQRSWGRTKQVFRHNCQSTYPPTHCWLPSLTVPRKHTFSCIYVWCFSSCVFAVFQCTCL